MKTAIEMVFSLSQFGQRALQSIGPVFAGHHNLSARCAGITRREPRC